ncbi:MAG: hypothetical protein RL328_812 [Acidobacteriota bacterium]|jgi:hypothetical protein
MSNLLANVVLIAAVVFQTICGISVVILLLRLFQQKVARQYWAFSGYLTVAAVELLLLPQISAVRQSNYFFALGAAKQPLAILLIWALSNAIFAGYPALNRFAAKAAGVLLAACAVLGGLSFFLEPALPAGRGPQLSFITAIFRALITGQLAFVIVLSVFAGWFPVRMSRNLNRLLVGWLALLATEWAGHLLANTDPKLAPAANLSSSLVILVISLYWTATINAKDTVPVADQRLTWDPERLERTTAQLTQMEAQLSRRGY